MRKLKISMIEPNLNEFWPYFKLNLQFKFILLFKFSESHMIIEKFTHFIQKY